MTIAKVYLANEICTGEMMEAKPGCIQLGHATRIPNSPSDHQKSEDKEIGEIIIPLHLVVAPIELTWERK